MKTRNKIILIVIIMPVLFYASVVTYATTPFEVFNPHTLFVFPSIVKQLVANEGNGKVCYDGCGPCSAWGYNYLLVEGECKIPDKVEDCYYGDPPMEWEFVDGECVPAKKYREDFALVDADLVGLTYKDFGISSSEPVYLIEVSTDEQLQRVLDRCEYKRKKASGEIPSFTPDGKPILSTQPLVSWNNSTHYNDNNICYFQPLKEHLEHGLLGGILEYCNSDKGAGWDNPFEVWFANETHYINSDTCLWQKLDDSIALVLPTDWQSVYEDDFDATWNGPGNRHPAFLGYAIPDICTEDMVKLLEKNSSMFDNDVPYSSPLDGGVLGFDVNPDDMVQCENELLENRDEEPSWNGK